jgi:hypothetical protein
MKEIIAYASGVNEAREVAGFALAGVPIGASAPNLREDAIQAILRAAGPVFLDSGAFSEVKFSPKSQRMEIMNRIAPREWRRRLDIYLRAARGLGDRLSVVAPDCVGDQAETLKRLALYRPELQQLAGLGARVLIPLQVGALSHEELYAEATAVAGVPLVPAFTMKKAVTSEDDAARFLLNVRPERIHLLGMGPQNSRAPRVVEMIGRCSPLTEISMDSNRLRAVTGKKRTMTVLERDFRSGTPEDLYSEVSSPVLDATQVRLDYTDCIYSPGDWATRDMLREIAISSGFSLSEMHAFFADPNTFIARTMPSSDVCYWEHPLVDFALDRAWRKYVGQVIDANVRTAAIQQTFQKQQPESAWDCPHADKA